MNTIIRKISVGKDYPNGSMHYQVGSRINLKGKPYTITSINVDKEVLERTGNMAYNIYITNVSVDSEPVSTRLWKVIIGLPTVVENNIDFS
jgi:hypothetical protein